MNALRFSIFFVLLVPCAVGFGADGNTATNGPGSVTLTFVSGGTVNISYSLGSVENTHPNNPWNSNATYTAGEVFQTTGSGGALGTRLWINNGTGAWTGATVSGGTTISAAEGSWLAIVVSDISGGDSPYYPSSSVIVYYNVGSDDPQTSSWQTTLKYTNDKPYPVTVKIFKDGELFHTETVSANTAWMHTVEDTAAEKPVYTWIAGVDGLAYDVTSESWYTMPSGTFHTGASGSIAADKVTQTPAGTPPTPANTSDIPTSPPNLPATLPTAGSGNVWRGGGTDTADGLTNAVFREGIDKVTAEQKTQITNQEAQQEALDKMVTALEGPDETESAMTSRNTSNANTLKDLALTLTTDAANQVMDLTPNAMPSAPNPTAPQSLLELKMPGGTIKHVKVTGVVAAVDTGALWIREIIIWGLAFMFLHAAWAKFEDYNRALPAVPQITAGDSSLGILSKVPLVRLAEGLVKQTILAGIIMGAMVAFLLGLLLAMHSELGTLVNIVGASWTWKTISAVGALVLGTGYSQDGGTAFAIIDRWVPIWACIQWGVSYLALGIIAAASFVTAAAVMKVVRI